MQVPLEVRSIGFSYNGLRGIFEPLDVDAGN